MRDKVCCFVCKEELSANQRLLQRDQDLKTCNASCCRIVVMQRDSMSASLFDIHFRQQQRLITSRRSARKEEEERVDAIRRQQAAERHSIRRRVYAEDPHLQAENILAVELPFCVETLSPLPIERIDSYRLHIERLVDEALAVDISGTDQAAVAFDEGPRAVGSESAVQAQLHKTSESMCALCQGGCCTRGGNTAYLNGMTLLRVRRDNPDWGRDQLLAAYLDRLKPETVTQSCVNHSSGGCSLPRELRSDTCNDFYCDSLREYRLHVTKEAGPTMLIAVQRGEPNWRRYAADADQAIRQVVLIDQNGVRKYTGLLAGQADNASG